MKLKHLKIVNYRSIVELDLPIDNNLTALVGANEHGKTNIMQAIGLLDFKKPIRNQDKRSPKDPLKMDSIETLIQYKFLLSEEEIAQLNGELSKLDFVESTAEHQPEKLFVQRNIADDAGKPAESFIEVFIEEIILEISYKDGSTNKSQIISEIEFIRYLSNAVRKHY